MKYQIRFTAGERVGECFRLTGDALSVGRSHTNVVRLQTPDVSGKHVNVTVGADGVVLENFSSRLTTVDDSPLALGDRKTLMAGQTIGLGAQVKFMLEVLADGASASSDGSKDNDATVVPSAVPSSVSGTAKTAVSDDDATVVPGAVPQSAPAAVKVAYADDDRTVVPPAVPPASADDDRTVVSASSGAKVVPMDMPKPAVKAAVKPAPAPAKPAPKPVPPKSKGGARPVPPPSENEQDSDSGEETIAMQTRMASAEELEYLKSSHEKAKFRKTGMMLFAFIAFMALLIGVYMAFFRKKTEQYVSWPVDDAGVELSNAVKMENCPYSEVLDLKYPDVPGAEIKSGAGVVEVRSFLGKYRDVPLTLRLEYFQDKAGLKQAREAAFERWMAGKTSGSENWNFDLVQPLAFYQYDHGVPYLCVPYSRTENNEAYVGYAVQIRRADWSFILMKEVPTRERWRAEWYIQQVCFFRFAEEFLNSHWEGTDNLQKGIVPDIVNEAKVLMQRRSPTVWRKTEYLLRSALCLGLSDGGDAAALKTAEELLVQLRKEQVDYYKAQKVAYLIAENKRDVKEKERIAEELKAVFSSEEDYRFHKIRQDKWD